MLKGFVPIERVRSPFANASTSDLRSDPRYSSLITIPSLIPVRNPRCDPRLGTPAQRVWSAPADWSGPAGLGPRFQLQSRSTISHQRSSSKCNRNRVFAMVRPSRPHRLAPSPICKAAPAVCCKAGELVHSTEDDWWLYRAGLLRTLVLCFVPTHKVQAPLVALVDAAGRRRTTLHPGHDPCPGPGPSPITGTGVFSRGERYVAYCSDNGRMLPSSKRDAFD